MLYDPEALVKLIKSADRNGVLEKGGEIVGEIMKNVLAEPGIDYEKFFTSMGSSMGKVDTQKVGKLMKIGSKILTLMNPFIRLLATDFVMSMVSAVLSIGFVKNIAVKLASKIGIMFLKGDLQKMLAKVPILGKRFK